LPGSGLRRMAAPFFAFFSFRAMPENALGNPREASQWVPRRGSQQKGKSMKLTKNTVRTSLKLDSPVQEGGKLGGIAHSRLQTEPPPLFPQNEGRASRSPRTRSRSVTSGLTEPMQGFAVAKPIRIAQPKKLLSAPRARAAAPSPHFNRQIRCHFRGGSVPSAAYGSPRHRPRHRNSPPVLSRPGQTLRLVTH
jgi:hypothetical protein